MSGWDDFINALIAKAQQPQPTTGDRIRDTIANLPGVPQGGGRVQSMTVPPQEHNLDILGRIYGALGEYAGEPTRSAVFNLTGSPDISAAAGTAANLLAQIGVPYGLDKLQVGLQSGAVQAEVRRALQAAANERGLIAYHGSPHQFEKFDISKFGTGEGGGMYGHGVYFAENPETAKTYAEGLARVVVDGKSMSFDDAYHQLLASNNDLKDLAGSQSHRLMRYVVESKISNLEAPNFYPKGSTEAKVIDFLKSKLSVAKNLYRVDIPDELIPKMLDWDKPLSQQAPEVQKALQKAAELSDLIPFGDKTTGETIYSLLARKAGQAGSKEAGQAIKGQVSQMLNDLGIPGIKYLDQGSRAAGQGTRNFVVFDPSILKDTAREVGGKFVPLIPEVTEDYRGLHTAPMRDSGSPMHNLKDTYPEDIYSSKGAQYYGHWGDARDNASISIIQQMRDKPNATIQIYRAVPKDLTVAEQIQTLEKQKAYILKYGKIPPKAETSLTNSSAYYDKISGEVDRLKALPEQTKQAAPTINPGDWVTIDRNYAKEHGESTLGGKYRIVSKRVKARDIFTNGDSIHEWGYDPQK